MIKNKKMLLVLLIISILGLVLGTTYSWLTWTSTNDSVMNITIGNIVNYEYKVNNEINTNDLAPVLDYKDGEVLEFSLNKYNIDNTKVNIYLYINQIDNELKDNSFKYVLEKDKVVISEGTFVNVNNNEKIYILDKEDVGIEKNNYKLYVYIDGSEENNNNMMNKKFNSLMNVEIVKEDDINEN